MTSSAGAAAQAAAAAAAAAQQQQQQQVRDRFPLPVSSCLVDGLLRNKVMIMQPPIIDLAAIIFLF